MAQISNPTNDRRSLSHNGFEVGDSNVNLSQNAAGQNSPVLSWTCPRKYQQIKYAGGNHVTKFTPRYRQDVSGAGSGAPFTVQVNGTLIPIAGETNIDDMQYQPVVAYNLTQGMEIEPSSYDFSQNEVTFDSGVSSGDDLALWPIMVEGTMQYRGEDAFGHMIAPLDEWSQPLHTFHHFEQNREDTKIHLVGAATWEEEETLVLYVESPRQIVWADSDYPQGEYASTIEQRVDVDV